jgi:hypothetical protein
MTTADPTTTTEPATGLDCARPDTFHDGTRYRCRNCGWHTPPSPVHPPARAVAAVCSCGAAVFHESPAVVEGFLAFHRPGTRPTCTRVESGPELDEVRARFQTAEQLGVLFL